MEQSTSEILFVYEHDAKSEISRFNVLVRVVLEMLPG